MQNVVEELVLLVPQSDAGLAEVVHRLRDVQEVLEELGGDIFVDRIVLRQLERDAHEIQGVHGHPAGSVRLIDVAAGRQLGAAVEDADVVQAEKSALEYVAALGVLAVHPPGEVQNQLVENSLQESEVAPAAALLAVHLI